MVSADARVQGGFCSSLKASARAPSARQAELRPTTAIGCREALQGRAVQWDGLTPRMQDAVGSEARLSACALSSPSTPPPHPGFCRGNPLQGQTQSGRAQADICPGGLQPATKPAEPPSPRLVSRAWTAPWLGPRLGWERPLSSHVSATPLLLS